MAQNLSIDDLGKVNEEIYAASLKWYKIGLQLKVSPNSLDKIKAEESDFSDKLLEMLKAWLKKVQPKPTWAALVKALKNHTVDEELLAAKLEKKYCKPKTPSAAAATARAKKQTPKGKADPMTSKKQTPVADAKTAPATKQKSTQDAKTTKRAAISTDEPKPKRPRVQPNPPGKQHPTGSKKTATGQGESKATKKPKMTPKQVVMKATVPKLKQWLQENGVKSQSQDNKEELAKLVIKHIKETGKNFEVA